MFSVWRLNRWDFRIKVLNKTGSFMRVFTVYAFMYVFYASMFTSMNVFRYVRMISNMHSIYISTYAGLRVAQSCHEYEPLVSSQPTVNKWLITIELMQVCTYGGICMYVCMNIHAFYKNIWLQFQPGVSHFSIYFQHQDFPILLLISALQFPVQSSVQI